MLESWLFAELFDGTLTEVLIEEQAGCRSFYMVISGQSCLKRFPVTPIDAILTGLRMGAPFLMTRLPRPFETALIR